jgi:hypothetical protein
MSGSAGQLAGKTKWLVARYPKPPGSMIKLGSILKEAKEPESSLNLESEEGIIEVPNKRDESVAIRATITSELSSNLSALLEAVVPASPVAEAAAKLQADKLKSAETVVKAMNVRAEIFLPSEDYMDKALANPKVIAYVKGGDLAFSRSVYIIVGVATAEKLSLKETLQKQASASAEAGASAAGGAAKGKLALSGGHKEKTAIDRQIDVDCDFAYRVREFIYSKWTWKKDKWSKGEDVSEGTMFGADGEKLDDKKEEIVEEEVPKFDELMEEDEAPPGLFAFSY